MKLFLVSLANICMNTGLETIDGIIIPVTNIVKSMHSGT